MKSHVHAQARMRPGAMVFLAAILLVANPGDGSARPFKRETVWHPYFGEYQVTFQGRVGGEYQPSNSIVSGTTSGIREFTITGNITLSAAEPGVITVKPGQTVPGVKDQDIILDAAVLQNPLHVFMGTPNATGVGDFGLHSVLRFGIPDGPQELEFTGCTKEGDPFNCVPVFLKRAAPSGRSVNLVYFVVETQGYGRGLYVKGTLFDRHVAEAAAANLFSVPISSPIMGDYNDPFMFREGTVFELTIIGQQISGTIRGSGSSVAGLVPQEAIFEARFEGRKK
jgi:hypothetical protein